MGTSRRVSVRDTAGSINLEVGVEGVPALDAMESILGSVAGELGMEFSHITTLGAKRYPGNRHWHLKRNPKEAGCLDVTYWPEQPVMWITMRRSEPDWVHHLGHRLGPALECQMRTA